MDIVLVGLPGSGKSAVQLDDFYFDATVLTFVSALVLLSVIALAATYVPARRAAKTDPIESLRLA